MKKVHFLLSMVLFLFSIVTFSSCQKESSKVEVNYQEIDDYLLKMQDLTNKIYDQSKINETFESEISELENLASGENLEQAVHFIEVKLNIMESELNELSLIGNTVFMNSNKTIDEFEDILEQRMDNLMRDGTVSFNFNLKNSGSDEVVSASVRTPCWWYALYSVITSATALAAGCGTGVGCIAGGVYAVATIGNTVNGLCNGGCSGGGC